MAEEKLLKTGKESSEIVGIIIRGVFCSGKKLEFVKLQAYIFNMIL